MSIEIDYKVGDAVYGVPRGNAERILRQYNPMNNRYYYVPGTVSSIGKKYVYIKFPAYIAKLNVREPVKDAATEDCNSAFKVFHSEEECKAWIEAVWHTHTIRDVFGSGKSVERIVDDFTVAGIEAIYSTCEAVLNKKNGVASNAEALLRHPLNKDQALMLLGYLQESILWPAEAREYLENAGPEVLTHIEDARKDEKAVDAFIQKYIEKRTNHDSDSGAVNFGEAWSREECLLSAAEDCAELDQYR